MTVQRSLALAAIAALSACNKAEDHTVDTSPTPDGCSYPSGAVEPMAKDEVLFPYSWAQARHRDGRSGSLDLNNVPCNTDPDIDWSPHDVLLFVSIPAW